MFRGSRLGSSVLSIPSPPVTSPEPMTHMAGSVSGFSCRPAVLPTTSCCTSICAMLPMSSSNKPSAFWASTSSTPHSMKCKSRNHFWKAWRKTLSRSESRSTTSIFAGRHLRVGIACSSSAVGTCGIRRGCIFPLQGLVGSPCRGPLQESCRACTGIFWPHRCSSLASSRAAVGFGDSGDSAGTWRIEIGHRRLFLPDSCSVYAERTGSGSSRLASPHRCATCRWRQRAAFSPTRALPHDGSRKPAYEGACAFRCGLSLMIRASEDAYENLEGRRLEALARLFAQNVRIYVYPMTVTDLREWLKSASSTGWEWTETNGWVSASQLRHAPPFGYLFAYLLASNFLVPMRVAPGT